MEPKIKFNYDRAEKLVHEILSSRIKLAARRTSVNKNPEGPDELTLSITDEIRASVRDMFYERYRLVVVVSLGELVGGMAEVFFASRCLWEPLFDTFVQATVCTADLYAVAVVYAVYCE